MRIGIDIDNVISNFTEELLNEYMMHDKKLNNKGIINENAKFVRFGMFDWTEDEEKEFYQTNIERIAKNLKTIKDSKLIIDKLKEDGNEIYIITGRDNGEYPNPREMTINWLKENDIYYDKLILTDTYDDHAKTLECLKYGIEIMIDDSPRILSDVKKSGIKTLLFDSRFNKSNTDLQRVFSWKEVYKIICDLNKQVR